MIIGNENFITRPYDDYPFLVLHKNVYNFQDGERINVRINVYQKDNLFGDSNPLSLESFSIKFCIYDMNNNLLNKVNCTVTNEENSQVDAILESYDIPKNGKYLGYFEFYGNNSTPSTNELIFMLPKKNDKQKIQINKN